MCNSEAAIRDWEKALGAGGVDESPDTCARYGRTLLPHGTTPCCVLRPTSEAEVQSLVRVAQQHRHPIYPISGGKNWGYGDACASVEQAAIVDLSGMNRIINIDANMGYAVIEPGVTQQQLYEAVQVEAPEFWVDVTGAGPNATVVGNAVERGFGHTPYGDHVRSTCGMTVVLPDGRLLKTGFGHFPGNKTQYLYPYGVGPVLDGLFSQSNLGIVTQIAVWLCPKPEAFSFFLLRVSEEERLSEIVEALRPLRMQGILNSAVHIGNDLRVFCSLDTYPWETTAGKTPLPNALRSAMRADARLGAWNVTGSLTGTSPQVRAARHRLKQATRHLGSIAFVDDKKLAFAQWGATQLQRLGLGKAFIRGISALGPNYGLLKGIPTDMPLQSLGWRLRTPLTKAIEDPLDTNVGLMWIAPVLPLRGEDAQCLMALVIPLFAEYGFDLPVTLTMLNERSMVAVMNISFDKSETGETERAQACYDKVTLCCLENGYIPYRSSLAGMGHLAGPEDVFWKVAQDIKSALDPGGVLAPGRYIPS